MTASPIKTLVLFAVREEMKHFDFYTAQEHGIRGGVVGMGEKNAIQSTVNALNKYAPELILTCGFAGGLRPDIPPGRVLYCGAYSPAWEDRLLKAGARPGTFHTSKRIAVTAGEKSELFNKTNADAVEMESGAIQRLCEEREIPCLTLRVILDAANEDLPLDFNKLVKEESFEIDFSKLAKELVQSPGKIPKLVALQRRTSLSARKLALVLHRFLQLPGYSA